ncbi:MAG: hypothetical protein M3362_15300 [Acidobacteriota bacterium]|nr:hypothetical protein [Acidobacteriota bacterium]
MRNIRKHALGPLFGLLILFSTISILTPVKKAWLRYTGAVSPSGSRTHTFTDKPARILSVSGQRWVTWDRQEEATVYYALVLFPSSMVNNNGFVSGGNDFTYTDIERWLVWNDKEGSYQPQLEIDYDAMWQTISVDSKSYKLSKGNLFVIRFDDAWKPTVTQLGITINIDASPEDLINTFKSALREDRLVQQL